MSKDESSATDASPLLVHVDDGIARLTLNRPARLNAFDAALAAAWAAGVDSVIARDDVRAIIVDATGPAFCAGGDVLSMASGIGSAAALEELAGVINRGITALVPSSIPVVAAAHGTTAGGGPGILLVSDYPLVGDDPTSGSPNASIGLTPSPHVAGQAPHARV